MIFLGLFSFPILNGFPPFRAYDKSLPKRHSILYRVNTIREITTIIKNAAVVSFWYDKLKKLLFIKCCKRYISWYGYFPAKR